MKIISLLFFCLFISTNAFTQEKASTPQASIRAIQDPGNTPRTTFEFYIKYYNFDNCTYNSNHTHLLRLQFEFDDGTTLCEHLIGEKDPMADPWAGIQEESALIFGPIIFPLEIPPYTLFREFVVLPETNHECYAANSSFFFDCTSNRPSCCFEFDCCDCNNGKMKTKGCG